tara:strand:- start:132 stop:548 length:417 start_codon:yes stop_codon:yes gene_type:complete
MYGESADAPQTPTTLPSCSAIAATIVGRPYRWGLRELRCTSRHDSQCCQLRLGPLPVWFIDAHDPTGAHRGNPDLAGMRRKQSVSRVFVSIGTPHRDVNLSIDQVGRCARQSGGQHRHHRFMDVLLGIYQCPVNSPAR